MSDRRGPARGVFWLENPGPKQTAEGAAWRRHAIGGQKREVMFLTLADLDHDGKRDIVCATRGGGFIWLRAGDDPRKTWPAHEIAMPSGCGKGKAVAVGDLDGDGRNDLVFSCGSANGRRSGVRWLRYDRSPSETVWRDHEISGPTGVKYDLVRLVDLDADGDLDVITCEERTNLGVVWYENPLK
ncbi:MAG: VCBS repeat-containing protein [Proteobacteria bacterium]|nr:VCBS repeat-containing protein [Pseudomonadota bacterium]